MTQPFFSSGKCLWASHRRKIRKRVIALHGMICWLCEEPFVDEASVTMDHIVSAHDGGLFRVDNLRPAHRECNVGRACEEGRRRKADQDGSAAK